MKTLEIYILFRLCNYFLSPLNQPTFGFVSKNPVLKNITDYLVDEGSFEEDELMGKLKVTGTCLLQISMDLLCFCFLYFFFVLKIVTEMVKLNDSA